MVDGSKKELIDRYRTHDSVGYPLFGQANPERRRISHWELQVRLALEPDAEGLMHSVLPPMPPEEVLMPRPNPAAAPPVEHDPSNCSSPDWPAWRFHRFGTSMSRLPDGRIVCVGGEFEDWYDEDFCIYNDVVVLKPAPDSRGKLVVSPRVGEVEIYTYPFEVFPPTDFHSATQVGNELVLIGSTGYSGHRTTGVTPVRLLDLTTYEIRSLAAGGEPPGWINGHAAEYDAAKHCIVVRGGKVYDRGEYRSSRGEFRLHLGEARWEYLGPEPEVEAIRFEGMWSWRPDSIANLRELLSSGIRGSSFEIADPRSRPERPRDLFTEPDDDGPISFEYEGVSAMLEEGLFGMGGSRAFRLTLSRRTPPGIRELLVSHLTERLELLTGCAWKVTSGERG